MRTMSEAASDFLAQKRFAVAGVSRDEGGSHGANVVYEKMRKVGYEVFPVNPNADEVMGDTRADDATLPDRAQTAPEAPRVSGIPTALDTAMLMKPPRK